MPSFILSTCGTSCLTNLGNDPGRLVVRHANAKAEGEIPADDLGALKSLIDRAARHLLDADVTGAASVSAEINAISRYYDRDPARLGSDYHLLLCTDTWLGEQAANLIATWLRRHCETVVVQRQRDLQTADPKGFSLALSDLVKWSEDTLPGYRNARYRIVFNLTGGFKSVQGFMQTLGMFYADEVIYVFQEADTLMRIPRLPVKLTADDEVRNNLTVFRRLARRLTVEVAETLGISQTLLMVDDKEVTLSPWGELVWAQTRDLVYRDALCDSPSPRIGYGRAFAASLGGLTAGQMVKINAKIDDLALLVETDVNLRSLRFHPVHDAPSPWTHECYPWSDDGARRLYGHYSTDGQFVLDALDDHL